MTARTKKAGSGVGVLHSIKTGETLQQNVEGHAARTESKTFVEARAKLHLILPDLFGGTNPWETDARSVDVPVQAHHGGSILFFDKGMWRIVLNVYGVEWCEQFVIDPDKLELVRQNAEAVIGAFPDTESQYQQLGLSDEHIAILHTPITDQDSIATYVDSIWNACVPIPQSAHTGTVSTKTPKGAGVHNYPLPACNIPMFCRDDFIPFVVDSKTHTAATVVPVAPRGSGDGRVRVVHTDPGNPLAAAHRQADRKGAALVLDPAHPVAKKAFQLQK